MQEFMLVFRHQLTRNRGIPEGEEFECNRPICVPVNLRLHKAASGYHARRAMSIHLLSDSRMCLIQG